MPQYPNYLYRIYKHKVIIKMISLNIDMINLLNTIPHLDPQKPQLREMALDMLADMENRLKDLKALLVIRSL